MSHIVIETIIVVVMLIHISECVKIVADQWRSVTIWRPGARYEFDEPDKKNFADRGGALKLYCYPRWKKMMEINFFKFRVLFSNPF